MNSKFLHFLFVLACAAMIGLGPLRAQSPSGTRDANGSAVATSSATGADASKRAEAASDSQRSANAAIANDRDTVGSAAGSHFHVGWLGLLGLFGLLGLTRRDSVQHVRRASTIRDDRPRIA